MAHMGHGGVIQLVWPHFLPCSRNLAARADLAAPKLLLGTPMASSIDGHIHVLTCVLYCSCCVQEIIPMGGTQ